MQALAGQRANCLAVFLEEKKKSEELKRALDSRKFKATYDFEAIFKDVQMVKGRYNRWVPFVRGFSFFLVSVFWVDSGANGDFLFISSHHYLFLEITFFSFYFFLLLLITSCILIIFLIFIFNFFLYFSVIISLKHGALVQVLKYCKTSYEKSLVKKEVELSPELIELLGNKQVEYCALHN